MSEDTPAAKLVVVEDIRQLQSSSKNSVLLNRAICSVFVIVYVLISAIAPVGSKITGEPHVGFLVILAGYVVQAAWVVTETFNNFELRRLRSMLALVDSPSYSSNYKTEVYYSNKKRVDWEDKFVGVRLNVVTRIYLAWFEPILWASMFTALLNSNKFFQSLM